MVSVTNYEPILISPLPTGTTLCLEVNQVKVSVFVSIVVSLLFSGLVFAEFPGGSDHTLIPRIAGSDMHGYAFSSYDIAPFIGAVEKNKLQITEVEGKRTRILYLAKSGDSPLMVQKNYGAVLAQLGEVDTIFGCRDKQCINRMSGHFWDGDAIIPTDGLNTPQYLMRFAHNYDRPSYQYHRFEKAGSRFHVGVFSVQIKTDNPNKIAQGRTAILVEVLEETDFEPTMEFVSAAEMSSEIQTNGHVALYGIQFKHDDAALSPDSAQTVNEIVSALQSDVDLAIYIVGHTDAVGEYVYNRGLSEKRAQSVVAAIVAQGITGERLTAVGVGPVAPIGANSSEEGRQANRRVELVRR